MRKLRLPALAAAVTALLLVELWQSLRYLNDASQISQQVNVLDRPPAVIIESETKVSKTDDWTGHASGDVTLSSPYASDSRFLTLDLLSVGSESRPDLTLAQNKTMGQHRSVRYFLGVTERDDFDARCQDLNRSDVKAVVQFCKLPRAEKRKQEKQHPHYNTTSLQQRTRYAGWDNFLERKENPTGWLCAQKRAANGLVRMFQQHYGYEEEGSVLKNNSTETSDLLLPDFLILMDDDTFMDLTSITEYLAAVYSDPNEALFMAGCLIQFRQENMTIPWGGWGTILSRGALRNLLLPIVCPPTFSNKVSQGDENDGDIYLFRQNACRRLQENQMYEAQYFRNGMTLLDLIHSFVTSNSVADYHDWNQETNFCGKACVMYRRLGLLRSSPLPLLFLTDTCRFLTVHSDWIWGYFFNYYNVGSHVGNPSMQSNPVARMASYRVSEFHPGVFMDAKKRLSLEGQCRFEKERCDPEESHICHYVQPERMYELTEIYRKRNPEVWKNSPESAVGAVPLHPHQVKDSSSLYNVGPNGTIPVFIYPFTNHSIEHELKHFLWDGVVRSSRLELSYNATTAPIWIIDARRAGLSGIKYCTRFVQLVKESHAQKKALSLLKQWKVAYLHWIDSPVEDFMDCFRATRKIDSTRIHRFKRSVVQGRQWNSTANFVESGHFVTYGNWRDHSGFPVQHIGYGVRSDMAEGIQCLALERLISKYPSISQLDTDKLVRDMNRSTDVSHFWPTKGEGEKDIHRGTASSLRDAVSEALWTVFSQTNYKFFIGLSGKAQDVGRNEVQYPYLAKLLDSKIVVVAQKDNWEDHYRLMEAMVSGALVMTDPMLTLPAGLEDGNSIVVYTSLDDLTAKVKHFLENEDERFDIARKGYDIVMSKHRSWHMVEALIIKIVADL